MESRIPKQRSRSRVQPEPAPLLQMVSLAGDTLLVAGLVQSAPILQDQPVGVKPNSRLYKGIANRRPRRWLKTIM